MNREDALLLQDGAAELGLQLTADQAKLFSIYLGELRTWGKRMNLVRRSDDREIILKDMLDSLSFLQHIPPEASLADCGSGAGFPGVPVKIARPDLQVWLFDSARKKVFFLKSLLRSLGLTGIQAVWVGSSGRAQFEGKFEFVATRAFGSLQEICSSCGPLVKNEGTLLVMKGRKGRLELADSLPSVREQGWELAFTENSRLPLLGHERVLIGLTRKNVPRGTF